jgi:hypothetical protein
VQRRPAGCIGGTLAILFRLEPLVHRLPSTRARKGPADHTVRGRRRPCRRARCPGRRS